MIFKYWSFVSSVCLETYQEEKNHHNFF
jgi:hypothetical protein